MADDTRKIITRNRKARHNYFVDEEYEAGIQLLGSEVKSLREGKIQLKDAYGDFRNHELYLANAHIPAYRQATHQNHAPERDRKLLMHRRQLDQLEHEVRAAGRTLVPLALYFKDSRVKVKLGLCRGKKRFDKRQDLKKREHNREIAREHARRQQGRGEY